MFADDGTPKALMPTLLTACGIKQGVPTTTGHEVAGFPGGVSVLLKANIVVRTPVMFWWFRTLKASAMSWSLARSEKRMVRDTRGSSEMMAGMLKVLRPKPGALSFRLLPSLLRSALTSAE